MSSDPLLDASGIVQRQFTTARRGYDADEVRAYLHELSTLVGTLQRRDAELRQRAEQAESRAHKAEQLDEHRLVEILGEETARVLDAARAASTDIRGKAEESASRLISEANQEAHRVRAEAEAALTAQRTQLLAEVEKLRSDAATELDRRRAEGAEIVAEMRREAQGECDGLRQQGEQKRLEAEVQAETIRAKAKEEGRQLIAEAQVVRERVLGDLARRRRSAREQLERLNAARERLLAAYEVVRRTVDEATSELTVVLPEAKIAGDSAMRRVKGEPEPSVEQLEDMVAMARITGLLEDAGHAFDDDYLDDDPPAPVASAPSVVDRADPVEMYDVETEPDLLDDVSDLLAGADLDPAGIEAEVDAAAEARRSDLASVNGHGRRIESRAPAPSPERAVPQPVALASEPVPAEAWSAATVGLDDPRPAPPVSEPSGREAVSRPAADRVVPPAPAPMSDGVAGADAELDDAHPDDEVVALDEGDDEAGLGDRRMNGHAHLAIDVGVELADEEDYAGDGYVDAGDDLGDEWPEDDHHDDGAPSAVDELFARLKAGRERPANGTTAAAASLDDAVLDIDDTVDRGGDHDIDGDHDGDGDGVERDEAERHEASERARARVSALAAMSDADILASAGYGDDFGSYGSTGGDDDFSDGESEGEVDEYGLAVTQPDPQVVVDDLVDDLAEDDDGALDDAAFQDMDADEAMLRLRDDSLETVEHDLSRRLKRVLSDEQNEVLDTLRRHKPSNLEDLLPGGTEAHVARYAEAAVEGLNTAAVWGAASVEGEPQGSCDVLAGELGQTIVGPLRERIARSFTDAGGDVEEVTSRLRSLYREWKGQHIVAAAQHYSVAAYARGAYEGVPDGTAVRWLVDRGSDSCPDADDNALAGSVCKGEAFPTGDRCPPAHAGCRCMVVPLDWPQLG